MDQANERSVIFRCPPELDAILPRPIPAVRGLPDWFKALPLKSPSGISGDVPTIKKCPPVIDAMTYGFLMGLTCDLTVENGEFSWDRDVPGGIANYPRSPIDFHESSQVAGTPFFDEDRFIIKFNSYWAIELPPGYSLLVMHPINRDDLPFKTLTGLVDADLYSHTFLHFPARWHNMEFSGTLPKGTPVAQCVPIPREIWTEQFETMTGATADRFREMFHGITTRANYYRDHLRAPKR